jgi:hypothetical protein
VDLQSFQIAGEHSPFRVRESGQVFRPGFSKDASSEGNEISALVHGTDGRIDIEIEFTCYQSRSRG